MRNDPRGRGLLGNVHRTDGRGSGDFLIGALLTIGSMIIAMYMPIFSIFNLIK